MNFMPPKIRHDVIETRVIYRGRYKSNEIIVCVTVYRLIV